MHMTCACEVCVLQNNEMALPYYQILMHIVSSPVIKSLQGKLKYREHVTDGFDNMFEAFLGLFKGDNIGKAVVKV